ncbi:MAG TPA: hypothetical protein VGK88_10700 [bacterium]|jgi:hypothetical protein
MKHGAVILCVGLAVLVLVGGTALGAMMTSQAQKELDTAIFHAKAAASYNSLNEILLHLHHVENCIDGPKEKDYFPGSGDVCKGMGTGIKPDLRDSGMAGAHALPYVEAAETVVEWGIARAMGKDAGRAKVAAEMAALILTQAKANFK